MIDRLYALLQRPEKGWDPIPVESAREYADRVWVEGVSEELICELDYWLGGLRGKCVLELGGGPGQYSVAFAKQGADVTWYDVSPLYLEIARKKAEENNACIHFLLGYMDEAPQRLGVPLI